MQCAGARLGLQCFCSCCTLQPATCQFLFWLNFWVKQSLVFLYWAFLRLRLAVSMLIIFLFFTFGLVKFTNN